MLKMHINTKVWVKQVELSNLNDALKFSIMEMQKEGKSFKCKLKLSIFAILLYLFNTNITKLKKRMPYDKMRENMIPL